MACDHDLGGTPWAHDLDLTTEEQLRIMKLKAPNVNASREMRLPPEKSYNHHAKLPYIWHSLYNMGHKRSCHMGTQSTGSLALSPATDTLQQLCVILLDGL